MSSECSPNSSASALWLEHSKSVSQNKIKMPMMHKKERNRPNSQNILFRSHLRLFLSESSIKARWAGVATRAIRCFSLPTPAAVVPNAWNYNVNLTPPPLPSHLAALEMKLFSSGNPAPSPSPWSQRDRQARDMKATPQPTTPKTLQ